jgi:type I restriction enzyme S subunit
MSSKAGFSSDAGVGQGSVAEVSEPSAKYLIDSAHKETVLGKIPVDWDTRTIGETFILINGCAFKPSDWKQSGLPIIRIQNLNDPEAEFNYSQLPAADKNIVESGDLLFAWSGTIGSSFGARLWPGPRGVLNQHIFKVLMDTSKMSKSFALLVFARVEQDIAREAHGFKASFVHVKKSDLQKVNLPIPPLAEQRAIATALSDVDALIAGLERLIAKKRDIKQAAMQQLLTGQARLPGFSGEWRECSLGQIAHIKTGSRNNENKVEDGTYPFFVRSANVERINTYSHECEAILVPGEGQIGSIFHYINGRFDVHQRVYAITQFGDDISGRFVHLFMSQHFGAWAMQNTVKATVDSLRLPTFQTFMLRVPPTLDEQTVIATVLSDMDADLSALESRLAKTRAIKQGMMQELLTGRTRLV